MPRHLILRLSFIILPLLGFAMFAHPAEARYYSKEFTTYRIVVFGDSFTSGYGINRDDAYHIPLRTMINEMERGSRIEVINAGVDHDTAAGGASRLTSVLALKPNIVIVAFGPNDARMDVDPSLIQQALEQILNVLTQNGIYVLIAGSQAPDDKDISYTSRYNAIFPTLAKAYQVAYMPNFLEGVEGVWYNLQYDGIHPNEEGMQQIAKNMLPVARGLFKKLRNFSAPIR